MNLSRMRMETMWCHTMQSWNVSRTLWYTTVTHPRWGRKVRADNIYSVSVANKYLSDRDFEVWPTFQNFSLGHSFLILLDKSLNISLIILLTSLSQLHCSIDITWQVCILWGHNSYSLKMQLWIHQVLFSPYRDLILICPVLNWLTLLFSYMILNHYSF